MKNYPYILLLITLFSAPSLAQVNFIFDEDKADSLQQIIPDANGRNKVDAINQLAYLYIRPDPLKCDSLLLESQKLCNQIEYQSGEAYISFVKGIMEYTLGRYSLAFEELYKSLEIGKEIHDTSLIIDSYYHLASLSYFSRTDIEQGISYMSKALQYALEYSDNKRIAQVYAALGYVAFHMGDGEKGKEMWEKYFEYIEGIPVSRIEKALMLASYGDCFELLGDYRTAINICLKAIDIFNPETIEERALLSQIYSYLGERYLMIGNADSALLCFKTGLALACKYDHVFGSLTNSLELAEYYFSVSNYEASMKFCDSVIYFGRIMEKRGSFYGKNAYDHLLGGSMEIFVPLTPDYKKYIAWNSMISSWNIMQKIYEKKNEINSAYKTLKASLPIKDSVINYNQKLELMEVLTRYESEQKERQIVFLSQENQIQQLRIRQNTILLAALILIVFIVIFMAIILIRQNKIKITNQAILLKQRLFRSQLNPHFIFNSLGSIQSSIINEEPGKATRYLSNFSKLMRNILESSTEELISLNDEVETIRNYLELQKIRFVPKFDFSIYLDDEIDLENTFLPPMLSQPFIENAIEHGIKHKKTKGFIQVSINQRNDYLNLEIEDDGIGRERSNELKHEKNQGHKSMATNITEERIAVLNKKLNQKIHFKVIDLKDKNGNASGTRVVFEIPLSL